MQTPISSFEGCSLGNTTSPPAAPALSGWKPGQGPLYTELASARDAGGLERQEALETQGMLMPGQWGMNR